MDDNTGIRGRNREITKINDFLNERIDKDKPGILYITGPPGTGKTMCIQYILNQYPRITKLFINCMKAQTSTAILSDMCYSLGFKKRLGKEQDMIIALNKKFSNRKAHIIVLDELDQLPKSGNVDLVKKIFSWPLIEGSRLILIGIANTLSLTAKCDVARSIMGNKALDVNKILFKPYSSTAMKSILKWYIENDENFEEVNVEPKVLDMISAKFSRENNGDIRGAINALRSAVEDANQQQMDTQLKSNRDIANISSALITPPSSPKSPCKEKIINIPALANSMKKRQKRTLYRDDTIPLSHQIIVLSVRTLHERSRKTVDVRDCKKLVSKALDRFGLGVPYENDLRQMLAHCENQGMIVLRRVCGKDKIGLKPGYETEIEDLFNHKDEIYQAFNEILKSQK